LLGLRAARESADRREPGAHRLGDELAAPASVLRAQGDRGHAALPGRRRPRAEPASAVGARRRHPEEDPRRQSGPALRFLTMTIRAFSVALVAWSVASHAQVPPTGSERPRYTVLLAAAAKGDAAQIKALVAKGEKVDARDGHGRTPLHVAAFGVKHDAMRALVAAGANPNALESDRYDIVTIAAV